MNISPVISYNQNRSLSISHKASIPVQIWVAEYGGRYARVSDWESIKDFNKLIINFLKFSPKKLKNLLKETEKIKDPIEKARKQKPLYETLDPAVQSLRADLAEMDSDYSNNVLVRSFYNYLHAGAKFLYLLTGDSVGVFNKKYGKKLGIEKSRIKALIKNGDMKKGDTTPELENAINEYNRGGFDFVNYYPRRVKNPKDGKTQVLHLAFVIEKDEKGKFKGYKFIGHSFCPEHGPGSY